MKNLLIIICLFSCTAGLAQTKEETEKFIGKCMDEAIGLKRYLTNSTGRSEEILLEKNYFSTTLIHTVEKRMDYKKGTYTQYNEYKNLNWANLAAVSVDTIPSLYHDDDVASITLKFSTKIKHTQSCESGTYRVGCDNIYYWDYLQIIVPSNRGGACKKAFDHMMKLYKEEEDNPFK